MVVDARRNAAETLAKAASEVAATADLRIALTAIACAAAEATGADLAVLRLLDGGGDLAARAVAPEGSALAAAVAGTRVACDAVAEGDVPAPTRRAAERAGAAGVLAAPALAG